MIGEEGNGFIAILLKCCIAYCFGLDVFSLRNCFSVIWCLGGRRMNK